MEVKDAARGRSAGNTSAMQEAALEDHVHASCISSMSEASPLVLELTDVQACLKPRVHVTGETCTDTLGTPKVRVL